jgi:hypothetical protein
MHEMLSEEHYIARNRRECFEKYTQTYIGKHLIHSRNYKESSPVHSKGRGAMPDSRPPWPVWEAMHISPPVATRICVQINTSCDMHQLNTKYRCRGCEIFKNFEAYIGKTAKMIWIGRIHRMRAPHEICKCSRKCQPKVIHQLNHEFQTFNPTQPKPIQTQPNPWVWVTQAQLWSRNTWRGVRDGDMSECRRHYERRAYYQFEFETASQCDQRFLIVLNINAPCCVTIGLSSWTAYSCSRYNVDLTSQ